MDIELPLCKLSVVATSVAEDLGFVALADVARVIRDHGLAKDVRLIGGHMVTLHAQRWKMGQKLHRDTIDADLGVEKYALNQLDAVEVLEGLGYKKTSGNRFERSVPDLSSPHNPNPAAVIEVLVPTHGSRARSNIQVGDLATTEVPGLATAFQRPPVEIQLELTRLNSSILQAEVQLPDEASALILKALAWKKRQIDKDAFDIWRCLEIAYRASVKLAKLDQVEAREAEIVIQEGFSMVDAPAMNALVNYSNLLTAEAQQRHTRIRGLVQKVL